MDKKFLNYTEWQDTADLVHLLLQMVGKVKLERCHKRPEWAHVRLYMTLDGLSSGIIPCSTSPFEIFVNLRKHQIEIHNEEGKSHTLPLEDGTSIAVYYHQFMDALEQIGAATEINIKPQEFYDPIPFDQDRKHHHYRIRLPLNCGFRIYFLLTGLEAISFRFPGKGRRSRVLFRNDGFDLYRV